MKKILIIFILFFCISISNAKPIFTNIYLLLSIPTGNYGKENYTEFLNGKEGLAENGFGIGFQKEIYLQSNLSFIFDIIFTNNIIDRNKIKNYFTEELSGYDYDNIQITVYNIPLEDGWINIPILVGLKYRFLNCISFVGHIGVNYCFSPNINMFYTVNDRYGFPGYFYCHTKNDISREKVFSMCYGLGVKLFSLYFHSFMGNLIFGVGKSLAEYRRETRRLQIINNKYQISNDKLQIQNKKSN